MSLLQHEEILSLETLDVIMPQARCCVAMGLEYRCVGVGTPLGTPLDTTGRALGPECALDCLYCILQQHCAIRLPTNCMVAVPAPMVRLPDPHVSAPWPELGYGL